MKPYAERSRQELETELSTLKDAYKTFQEMELQMKILSLNLRKKHQQHYSEFFNFSNFHFIWRLDHY